MGNVKYMENHPVALKRFLLRWVGWTFANLIGGAIGWALVAILMMVTLGIAYLAAWLIVGACVGTIQYLVLLKFKDHTANPQNYQAAIWIAVTILSMLLTFLCADSLQTVLYTYFTGSGELIPGYAVGGFVYGTVQGLATRRNLRVTAIWGAACAIGWAAGVETAFQIAQAAMNWIMGHTFDLAGGILLGPYDALYVAIAGTTGTFVFGLITGPFFTLLRWPQPPPSPPDNPGTPQTAQNDPGSS